MATIGHTLVGLSFAGMSRATSRGVMRHVWPGLMILTAHLVDVVEWITIVSIPRSEDGHYLTHSLAAALGLMTIYLAVVIGISRLRRAWPMLLIAAALLSHLPMDAAWTRDALGRLYPVAPAGNDGYSLKGMILAEVWSYGLFFLSVVLLRGACRQGTPRNAKRLAVILFATAAGAAVTRNAFLWLPVYVMGFIHAGLMQRRDLQPRLSWGAVFLLPIVVTVAGEAYSSHLLGRAWGRYLAKDYDGAILAYEEALRFPMRASPAMTYAHMGQVFEAQGKFAEAEKAFLTGVAVRPLHQGARYWLAWFYANRHCEGTPYFRPQEAIRLAGEILASDARPRVKESCRWLLNHLSERGYHTE